MLLIQESIIEFIEANSTLQENGCRHWNRGIGRDGYGRVNIESLEYANRGVFSELDYQRFLSVKFYAQVHRALWIATHGFIPSSTPYVLHLCNNVRCCEISHLVLGSQKANMQHAKMSGRKTDTTPFRRTEEEVEDIRDRLMQGQSMYSICKLYGVQMSAVTHHRNVLRREGLI